MLPSVQKIEKIENVEKVEKVEIFSHGLVESDMEITFHKSLGKSKNLEKRFLLVEKSKKSKKSKNRKIIFTFLG